MERNDRCPICGSETDSSMQLRFNTKLKLPIELQIRHCASDNFLFVANGCQSDYDQYYKSLANDTVPHAEVSEGSTRSVIANLQMDCVVKALDGFFERPRKVFDFGCGEACLLVELASEFPSSSFLGFDPGPAASDWKSKGLKAGIEQPVYRRF